MNEVLKFIADTFDLNMLVLFLISSAFLLLLDCREYKNKKLKREYKFARFFGIFYICFASAMYIFARLIRM